jgi:hypothetical protein
MQRRHGIACLTALAVAVVTAWLPARAGAPSTASRVLSISYSQPGGVTPVLSGDSSLVLSPGGWQSVGPREDHLSVGVHDVSGLATAVSLEYQPTVSSGTVTVLVCGASGSLRVLPGSEVRVTPVVGYCTLGQPSLPTWGTIDLTFTRPLPPPSRVIPPDRRWAVIIGISQYAGNTHPTYGGTGDAEAVRTALLKSGWRSDHLLILLDAAASGSAIMSAMSWLASHSSPTSYSLFHYSGHVCIASRGPCAAGHTYLWSQDNRFIPESTVASVLGSVQGPAWFDFAGCESGAFNYGLSTAHRMVTAASQANETAYENPEWHESIWTGLVFDRGYLHGQAGAAPLRATISQIVAYGRTRAPQLTSAEQAGPQHPYAVGGLTGQTLFAPHW